MQQSRRGGGGGGGVKRNLRNGKSTTHKAQFPGKTFIECYLILLIVLSLAASVSDPHT